MNITRGDGNTNQDHGEYQYLCYGIPAGLLVGTVIAVLTPLVIGTGGEIGMMLGIIIGATIDYGKNEVREIPSIFNRISPPPALRRRQDNHVQDIIK